jgi:hypothetical protein
MLKESFVLLILCLVLTSCAVTKDAPQRQMVKVEKRDFKKLNAQFSNFPTNATGVIKRDFVSSSFKERTFWDQIAGNTVAGTIDDYKRQTVTLEFLSNKKAIAKLWDNGELKRTKKIRGRIKDDGYFYRRPFFIVMPTVPLVFGYSTRRYRIGLTSDSIVVDSKWDYWAFAIFAGSYSKGQCSSTFKKK